MGKTKAKPAPKPKSPPATPPAEVQTPAPARPADLAAGLLPLARIRASAENPRKTFDDIDGLTASVRAHGILQPILVRPVGPAPKALGPGKGWSGVDYFEVVAGERRFRAAAAAGLAELPVVVRFLSDAEARPLRHVENGQREPVRVSEEARAVAEWAAGGTPAEEIAGQIGKPVAAVRALVRLARLPAWALAAVDAGTLPRATAELVARVPGEAAREKAAVQVLTGTDDWGSGDGYERTLDKLRAGKTPAEIYHNWYGPKSFREAKETIAHDFTRQLKGAPFSLKVLYTPAGAEPGGDAALPACDLCPKRAGNDDEAKADGVRADVCLDPDCYRQKLDAHDEQERVRFRKRFKLDPDAEVNPDGAALDANGRPARGWCDWNGTFGGSELSAEVPPQLHAKKVSEVVLHCPVVHGCWPHLVLDEKHQPRLLVKTADARKTLTAADVIKKPERAKPERAKPEKKPQPTNPAASPWDRPADAAAKPAQKVAPSDYAVHGRAAEIGAKVIGEFTLDQFSGLSDDTGGAAFAPGEPIHKAALALARFLVWDHVAFGEERLAAVNAVFGGDSKSAAGMKLTVERLREMSAAELLSTALRLVAVPALLDKVPAADELGGDLLDWAELDWPQLTDQARRELAGGEPADAKLAAAEAAPPVDEPPDRDTPEGALHRALHCYEGAAGRWAKVKAAGATDAELKEQIGEALGSEGGSYGPGKLSVQYKGGKDPAVWIGSVLRTAKPTLAGKPLVEKVREVLGIPLPKAEPIGGAA